MATTTHRRSATETLVREHDVILRVLTAFERVLDAGAREGALPREDAGRALEFFRTFADRCHHGKEELVLFSKLVEMGLPDRTGPLAVMRSEHEQGRAFVTEMLADLDAAGAGQGVAVERFVHAGRSYLELLRDHIAKENQILFPLSEGYLDDSANEEVLGGFDIAETEHEPGTHERMLDVADDLCRTYHVEAEDVARFEAEGSGACGG